MRWPFRTRAERQIEVRLYVKLEFESRRLADLIQLLAKFRVTITELLPDRSLYQFGMPERSAEVVFLAKDASHKAEILRELSTERFEIREITGPIQ